MNINCINTKFIPSFKSDFVYKDRYIPNEQDCTTDVVRAHLEYEFGPYVFYHEQLEKEKAPLSVILANYTATSPTKTPNQRKKKNTIQIDFNHLKKQGISSLRERRKNELYSGQELSNKPEAIKELKNVGFKSVICLVPSFDYEEQVIELGMNFKSLRDFSLDIHDLHGDMMKQLINHPELYAGNNSKGTKVESLKTFINTLNGKNPDMPLPLYFGCNNGTDRTVIWYSLYSILKDEDMDKPLSPEVVEKLVEFRQNTDDYFRW